MPIAPGTRFGPYEVLASLGAGGMGEVYRAHDAKLGRDVALKILPDLFVADADRLARFEREAKTLASLNHPNIAQIYGMEAPSTGSGQSRALVMELVEGQTLEEIIGLNPGAKAPGLHLNDALPLARQIAAALEAAHGQGIIHRDLKPANIKVRPDGTVKVLDFGLAKGMAGSEDPASNSSFANSPTMTSPAMTQFGMILGTAAYMSPEQARGKVVDRRADVWAFGVVLYEMLTGRRAFPGNEISDVLASVLKDTIPLGALPADTPPSIRRLLRRCLEKDRAERLDSMAAARLEIADAMASKTDGAEAGATGSSGPRSRTGAVGVGALVVAGVAVGLVVGMGLLRPAPAAPGRTVSFTIPVQGTAREMGVAITRAGDTVVYEAGRLYVRHLADSESHPLPGTEGARNLFLSTDDRWAGFFVGGKIKKIALAGGDALAIADAEIDTPGAAWGPNNTIIFSGGWNAPLLSVSADGGPPAPLTTVDTAGGELGHWWPEVLPGGKTALFTIWMAAAGINDSRIGVLDLTTGTHRTLMPGAYPKYLASGHLLFFHAGAFHIIGFDPAALRTTGEAAKILPDARPLDPSGTRMKPVSVSAGGTLAYLSGPLHTESQLTWVTPGGAVEPIGQPRRFSAIALAPDGKRVAASRIESGTFGVWLHDLARQTEERIEFAGSNFGPVWNHAGDLLAFTSMRAGHFDVSILRLQEGVARPLIADVYDQSPVAFAHDGKRMVLTEYFKDGSSALSVALIDSPKDRVRLPGSAGAFDQLDISPDDKWMAIETSASGRREIIVQPFQTPGPTVQVSSRGGEGPVWSKTGSKLFYRRGEELVAATCTVVGGRFTVTHEDTLLPLGKFELIGIAPDGRFLIAKDLPDQPSQLQVVVNWLAELRK